MAMLLLSACSSEVHQLKPVPLTKIGGLGGTIGYGTRRGQDFTIISASGLGTSNAIIKVKHTSANAQNYCRSYLGDRSKKCIADLIDLNTYYPSEVRANCKTGVFSTLVGIDLQFIGRHKTTPSDAPYASEYDIVVMGEGQTVGTAGGTYYLYLDTFRKLCPRSIAIR